MRSDLSNRMILSEERTTDSARSGLDESHTAISEIEQERGAAGQPGWRRPPVELGPPVDAVHVWRLPLDLHEDEVPAVAVLSDDERDRAARMQHDGARRHFVVARTALRQILARYLTLDPQRLIFTYGPNGKPALDDQAHEHDLRFNVSHAGERALVAVAQGRDVGVDVEQVRPEMDVWALAERFFAPTEIDELHAMPETQQRRAFFHGWTRKEAFLKATGQGITIPLDRFAVALDPDADRVNLHTPWDPPEASRWTLQALTLDDQHAAAVAAEGDGWALRCWQWHVNGDGTQVG